MSERALNNAIKSAFLAGRKTAGDWEDYEPASSYYEALHALQNKCQPAAKVDVENKEMPEEIWASTDKTWWYGDDKSLVRYTRVTNKLYAMEALKKKVPAYGHYTDQNEYDRIIGWNDCLDHLASTGHLTPATAPDDLRQSHAELIEALRAWIKGGYIGEILNQTNSALLNAEKVKP